MSGAMQMIAACVLGAAMGGFPAGVQAAAAPATDGGPSSAGDLVRPRDGNVAIREEFDAAIAAGTREAIELFIARHPDHALAADARRALADLPDARER